MARTYNDKTQFNGIAGLAAVKAKLLADKRAAKKRSQQASKAGLASVAARGIMSRKLVDRSIHSDPRGCVQAPVKRTSRIVVTDSQESNSDARIAGLAREAAQGKRGAQTRLYGAVEALPKGRAVGGVVDAAREQVRKEREAAREAKRVARRVKGLAKEAAKALRLAQVEVSYFDQAKSGDGGFRGGSLVSAKGQYLWLLWQAYLAERKAAFASQPGKAFARTPWVNPPNGATLRQQRTSVARLMFDCDWQHSRLAKRLAEKGQR